MPRTPQALVALAAFAALSACGPNTMDAPIGSQTACPEGDCWDIETEETARDRSPEAAALEATEPVWQAAVELEVGDGIDFDRHDISIDVAGVKDTRCPAGATCTWQGMISAQLDVVVGTAKGTLSATSEQPAYLNGVRIEILEARSVPSPTEKDEPTLLSLVVSEFELLEMPGAGGPSAGPNSPAGDPVIGEFPAPTQAQSEAGNPVVDLSAYVSEGF